VDFWDQVGAFLETFEPKDWVTSALAVLAIILSVLSLRQTRYYYPRPYFRAERTLWSDVAEGGAARPALDVKFTNYGADAVDASWVIRTPAMWLRRPVQRLDKKANGGYGAYFATVPRGEHAAISISLASGDDSRTQDPAPDAQGNTRMRLAAGLVLRGLYVFVLRWRQPPDRFRRFRIYLRIVTKRDGTVAEADETN
jgi:hypothetical protein